MRQFRAARRFNTEIAANPGSQPCLKRYPKSNPLQTNLVEMTPIHSAMWSNYKQNEGGNRQANLRFHLESNFHFYREFEINHLHITEKSPTFLRINTVRLQYTHKYFFLFRYHFFLKFHICENFLPQISDNSS